LSHELTALKTKIVEKRITEVHSCGRQASAYLSEALFWLYSSSLLMSCSFRFHLLMMPEMLDEMLF